MKHLRTAWAARSLPGLCCVLLVLTPCAALALSGVGVSAPDTLDSKPPQIAVIHPHAGAVLRGAQSDTLRWTIAEDCWDSGTPVTLTVFDDGGDIWSDSVESDPSGTYTYVWLVTDQNVDDARLRIEAVDGFGWAAADTSEAFDIENSLTDVTPGLLLTDGIGPVYPNPFNPMAKVAFTLSAPANIRLAVFDARGRRVASLASGPWDAGKHSVVWNGHDSSGRSMPSGVYLARLSVRGSERSGDHVFRMTLVK